MHAPEVVNVSQVVIVIIRSGTTNYLSRFFVLYIATSCLPYPWSTSNHLQRSNHSNVTESTASAFLILCFPDFPRHEDAWSTVQSTDRPQVLLHTFRILAVTAESNEQAQGLDTLPKNTDQKIAERVQNSNLFSILYRCPTVLSIDSRS